MSLSLLKGEKNSPFPDKAKTTPNHPLAIQNKLLQPFAHGINALGGWQTLLHCNCFSRCWMACHACFTCGFPALAVELDMMTTIGSLPALQFYDSSRTECNYRLGVAFQCNKILHWKYG